MLTKFWYNTPAMQKARRLSPALVAFLALLLSSPAPASIPTPIGPIIRPIEHVKSLAFGPGERLVFHFGWNDIPAAEMSMQVSRVKQNGRWLYFYKGEAKSLPHIEWIYPLRDQVEAVLDEASLEPLHYALYQDEKGRKTSTVVHRDGENLTGTRKNFKNKTSAASIIRDGHYDPVTIAYLARSIKPVVGQSYTYRVFDGRYEYLLTMTVEAKESIKVSAGRFNAIRIRPSVVNLTKPNLEKKVKRATIWISDDAARVPLRVESEVFFGKVYGELVAYARGEIVVQ